MAAAKPFKYPDYTKRLDFYAIANQDEDFSEILRSNGGSFDWQNPEHLLQLTKSILRRDFGLKLKLPKDRLCPPIPIRWSYIRRIQELIDSTPKDYRRGYDPSRKVTGIDIGVGSSCIYPLLGCTARPNWKFVGTDIDETNYNHAVYNVTNNELDRRICLVKTLPTNPLFSLDRLKIDHADFTMCNPPFFDSKQDMMSTFDKDASPSAVCTGAEVEMITKGGEVVFVSRMIDESKVLGERIQWYSSMLGKLGSLQTIVEKLKFMGCSNWTVGVLNPQEKTRRWFVGWSWGDLRPESTVARHKDIVAPQVWPSNYPIAMPAHTQNALTDSVNIILAELALDWSFNPITMTGLGISKGDVWSRHARRRRKLEGANGLSPSSVDIPDFVFRVTICPDSIELRWLKGSDAVLWDSFCGMMRRKLTGNVATAKIIAKGKSGTEKAKIERDETNFTTVGSEVKTEEPGVNTEVKAENDKGNSEMEVDG